MADNAGTAVSRLLLLTGAASSALGPQRPAHARGALPPWPPGSYQRTPPAWPLARDPFRTRANFCGLHYPDAPVVPGCNAARPETVMSCLLDNYPADFADRYLDDYASAGYTHLQRSLGHALYYGRTLDQYVALSARARGTFGLLCDHWLLNGGENPAGAPPFFLKVQNQDGAYWDPVLRPLVQRLLDAGVIDSACVGWQLDQLQQSAPGNPTLSIIQLVAGLLPDRIPLYSHWVNHAGAWWYDDGHGTVGQDWTDAYGTIFVNDRFTWWRACSPYLTGLYYQGDTHLARTNPTEFQGRMRDTLNPFNGTGGHWPMGRCQRHHDGRPLAFVPYELTGQEQFNEPQPDGTGGCGETEGDQVGLIMASCTADGLPDAYVAGYGNGARRADGTAL